MCAKYRIFHHNKGIIALINKFVNAGNISYALRSRFGHDNITRFKRNKMLLCIDPLTVNQTAILYYIGNELLGKENITLKVSEIQCHILIWIINNSWYINKADVQWEVMTSDNIRASSIVLLPYNGLVF